MKSISVAMTTYNGEKFLNQQLQSIAAQSRQIDELVVCDDGSVDGTIDILNDFVKKVSFNVKLLKNEKNLGCTKNFEKAMSLCTGDIIVLCDQDDLWLPKKIKVLENVFSENPDCGMVFTDAEVFDEENQFLYYLWQSVGFTARRQKLFKRNMGTRLLLKRNVATGATAAVTKTFFEEALPFPEETIHDYWLAMIAVLKNKLVFLKEATIKYRKHSAQQIGCGRNVAFEADFNFDKTVKLYKALKEGLESKKLLNRQYSEMLADKIDFFMFRRDLSRNRIKRICPILFNMFQGNYSRHSSGLLSAAKDFLGLRKKK